ncbi:hypothetical protein AB0M46_45450 [Dactylosporangium sp. NPDC051485]|uniref:hypothetical protein n=1 Tax=Dactylosporangium sp. NPDC051485 TaxID=3154846 RepID=UPI00341AA7B0
MELSELTACEDVVMFVNAAVAATGQREFHTEAEEQRLSLRFLHDYVRVNYREIYASTLALDINDLNAATIALHLLRSAQDVHLEQRRLEGRLIAARLARLAPQRVYRLFRALRAEGINNRRTRAIVRDWVAARPDVAFDAVKYRRGLTAAAGHAHLRLPTEVGTVLFDWRRPKRYATPILESWRRAHYEKDALFDLPYTVAEGLASTRRRDLDRAGFLRSIAPRLTELERLRLQRSGGEAVGGALERQPLTRLALYALSLPRPERSRRREELTAALRAAARRAAGRRAGTWGPVVAVLDDSYSSSGSAVKRRRPLAVALAAHYLLEALSPRYRGLWLNHTGDPLLVHPAGATPLGERLLDALEQRPDRVIVVSDGWDNAPPGQAAEVLRVWRQRLDPAGRTSVVHLNPVFDGEAFDVRRLSPFVPSVGVRDAEDIAALVELARFATGAASFAELSEYLRERVEGFLR